MKTRFAVLLLSLTGCATHQQPAPPVGTNAPSPTGSIQVVAVMPVPQSEADVLRRITAEELRDILPFAVEIKLDPAGAVTPSGNNARRDVHYGNQPVVSETRPSGQVWQGNVVHVTYTIFDASGSVLENHDAAPMPADVDHVKQYRSIVKEIAGRIKELQTKS